MQAVGIEIDGIKIQIHEAIAQRVSRILGSLGIPERSLDESDHPLCATAYSIAHYPMTSIGLRVLPSVFVVSSC